MAQLGSGTDPDGFFRSKKQLAELIITCFLAMIRRNNTMYMILIGAPFSSRSGIENTGRARWWRQCRVSLAKENLHRTGDDAPGVERVDAREAYNAIIQNHFPTYQLAPEDFIEEEKELLFEVILRIISCGMCPTRG